MLYRETRFTDIQLFFADKETVDWKAKTQTDQWQSSRIETSGTGGSQPRCKINHARFIQLKSEHNHFNIWMRNKEHKNCIKEKVTRPQRQ